MSECLECGEQRKDRLLTHPVTSGDRICVDCSVNWHNDEIENLETELRALLAKQASLDLAAKPVATKALDGKPKGRK